MSGEQYSATYSLHKITNSENFSFSPVEFSRFKFGDDRMAYKFGAALAQGFIKEHLLSYPDTEFVVACSYQFIPTAAHSVRKHFLFHLNRWMATHNRAPVQEIKIHRVTTYQLDYGTLTAESRAAHIGADSFHIDKELVANKTIIVLDDIRITGGHELRIERMFKELGINQPVFFLYFAELASNNIEPGIEHKLNFYAIHNIFDIEEIVKSGRFAINARFVKYVLTYEHKAFCQFLQRQDEDFTNLLLDMSIGNGYHKEDKYAANMEALKMRVCFDSINFMPENTHLVDAPLPVDNMMPHNGQLVFA